MGRASPDADGSTGRVDFAAVGLSDEADAFVLFGDAILLSTVDVFASGFDALALELLRLPSPADFTGDLPSIALAFGDLFDDKLSRFEPAAALPVFEMREDFFDAPGEVDPVGVLADPPCDDLRAQHTMYSKAVKQYECIQCQFDCIINVSTVKQSVRDKSNRIEQRTLL